MNAVAALLLLCAFGLSHASIIKLPTADDEKTPWDLISAIYGTSGLRGFNGTWIT
ncbi:hypothetical protein AWZ03_014372, partial [Drosophila navojoa]